MSIVEYEPGRFEDLRQMVAQVPGPVNLAHRPFVDYYYATSNCSKLYLYYSNSGKVIGTLGRELVRFECNSREVIFRIGSNWYSLQRGVGGALADHSVKSSPDSIGLMFSGSDDTLAILHHRNWIFMPGVRGYFLNESHRTYRTDSWLRKRAKAILRRAQQRRISTFMRRIPAQVSSRIKVVEEHSYSPDLLPSRSPFLFRMAPTVEYLNWRYNLSLSFLRYRLFRIVAGGNSVGYVILSDSPGEIVVAQCDGEDPTTLAYGVLLSILEVGRNDVEARTVFLTCCDAEMRNVFLNFGFREQAGSNLPFAFRNPPPHLDLAEGTSRWLVNFALGDNGVRPPFHELANGRS